jgi:3'-phosphoadenosine 5'-phosphosulfate sulfotransferase (PAPS reductase)/FAD synthetase
MSPEKLKITPQELQLRLAWSLDMKTEWACKVLSEFIIHMRGKVYLSFSGGKDSQIVEEILNRIWDGSLKHLTPNWERLVKYDKPVKCYSNTGLEFPEIVDHVKKFDNVTVVKPLMGFTRVVKEFGFAIGSKKTARMIRDLRNPTDKNQASRNLYLTGIKQDGTQTKSFKLAKKWHKLIDAPFKVSDQCCDILKKEPFVRFERETGLRPIVGTTTSEGTQRRVSYLQTGCNSFEEGKEKCRPLSIWTDADVWEFADRWNIKFAPVYYDRIVDVEQVDGTIVPTEVKAETQTGCMWCMFGVQEESKKENNRIQRIAISHPKIHDIIINKIGMGEVLKFIGVDYKPINKGCQKYMFKNTD